MSGFRIYWRLFSPCGPAGIVLDSAGEIAYIINAASINPGESPSKYEVTACVVEGK